MEFTINCTRVPIPQGTTLYGIPVDEGSAPASQGPVSDNDVPNRTSNDGDVLNPIGRISPNIDETAPETTPYNKYLSCLLPPFSAHLMLAPLIFRVD